MRHMELLSLRARRSFLLISSLLILMISGRNAFSFDHAIQASVTIVGIQSATDFGVWYDGGCSPEQISNHITLNAYGSCWHYDVDAAASGGWGGISCSTGTNVVFSVLDPNHVAITNLISKTGTEIKLQIDPNPLNSSAGYVTISASIYCTCDGSSYREWTTTGVIYVDPNATCGSQGCSSSSPSTPATKKGHGPAAVPFGVASVQNACVGLNFGLGAASPLQDAGILSIHAECPGTNLTWPGLLCLPLNRPSVIVVTNVDGTIHQLRAPQGLINITVSNAHSYNIEAYYSSNVTGPSGGVYGTTGSPFAVWTISNPMGSISSNQLWVTENRGGTITQHQFTNSPSTGGWDLLHPDQMTLKSKWTTNTSNPSMTNLWQQTMYGSGVNRMKMKTAKYLSGSSNVVMTQLVNGSGAGAQTSNYSYYSPDATNGSSTNLLQRIDYPNGGWAYYVYDSSMRKVSEYSAYLNSAAPATNNVPNPLTDHCKVTQYTYSLTNATDGIDDDGSVEAQLPRKTVVQLPVFNGSTWSLQEVSRTLFSATMQTNPTVLIEQTQICPLPGAKWNDIGNLKSIQARNFFAHGDTNISTYLGQTIYSSNPDGTATVYSYQLTPTNYTITTQTGQPDSWSSPTTILDGSQTVETFDDIGNITSIVTKPIQGGSVSSIVTDQQTYNYKDVSGNYLDALRRSYDVTDLAGRTYQYRYGCCGLSSVTDPDSVTTSYTYDSMKRLVATTVTRGSSSVTSTQTLDGEGNVLMTTRTGNDSSIVTNATTGFNTMSEAIWQTNALGGVSSFTSIMSGNQMITTNVAPDGGTSIQIYYADGRVQQTAGTAVNPVQYLYGTEQDGVSGPWREYTVIVKLDSNGGTNEWGKTYSDGAGRRYKTMYATNGLTYPYSISFYNTLGQLTNQVDPDGVSTLFVYNARGELQTTVLDMNQNYNIEYLGSDRISWTTNDVVVDNGSNVQRARTYVWNTSGSASSNLVSTTESTTDGLAFINIAYNNGVAIASSNVTAYFGGGYRSQTSYAPDGTRSVSVYKYGQLIQSYTTNTTLGQLRLSTNSYDPHDRLSTVADARTGTSTNFYNAADLISSISTTGSNLVSQTTSQFFDTSLRNYAVQYPDGTFLTNVFTPKGQITKTYGSRQYPVGYGFDAQGRMTTMTNWTASATGSGARVTSWYYDVYRGWLTNKDYPNLSGLPPTPTGTNGPVYTYSAAGRILTRKWARGVYTTNSYDAAGQVSSVNYNDGTASVSYTFDRLGRQIAIINGTSTSNFTLNDAGNVLIEAYTNGILNGLAVTNGYDTLLRRTNLMSLANGVPLTITTNNYDAASRLSLISDGTNSATYSYLANSPFVQQIVFTQNGATRMITTNGYDNLNRLTRKSSVPSAASPITFDYRYDSANQRTKVTNADGTYWIYGYDSLGQVTSGGGYWSDGTSMAGEQFGYAFDEIGNRTATSAGGDQYGANQQYASYNANALNQYTSRTVPSAVDILGSATNASTVTVNNQLTYRHNDFYRAQLAVTNTTGAVYQPVTNMAVLNRSGTTPDLISNVTGNVFVPQTPEQFTYDADGNLTQDGRWTYSWDAENRLISMVSLTNAPVASKLRLTFGYDSQWRRTSKTVEAFNGSSWTTNLMRRFVYNGWNLQAELNATNNSAIHSFMWGLDLSGSLQGAGGVGGMVSLQDNTAPPGMNYFPYFDGNGNVMGLVYANTGANAAQYEYGPFGEAIKLVEKSGKVNPFRFSTSFVDEETHFIAYGLRYFNPSQGRWLNRDPIGEMGGINLNAFLNNETLAMTDVHGSQSAMDAIKQSLSTQYNDFGQYETVKATGFYDLLAQFTATTAKLKAASYNPNLGGGKSALYDSSSRSIVLISAKVAPRDLDHEMTHAYLDIVKSFPQKGDANDRNNEGMAYTVADFYDASILLKGIELDSKLPSCDDAVKKLKLHWPGFWKQYGIIPDTAWGSGAYDKGWIREDIVYFPIVRSDILNVKSWLNNLHLSCKETAAIINGFLSKNGCCCRVSCKQSEDSSNVIPASVQINEIFQ